MQDHATIDWNTYNIVFMYFILRWWWFVCSIYNIYVITSELILCDYYYSLNSSLNLTATQIHTNHHSIFFIFVHISANINSCYACAINTKLKRIKNVIKNSGRVGDNNDFNIYLNDDFYHYFFLFNSQWALLRIWFFPLC